MTITESQRRTLDLMAESAGWGWADVEALSQEMYHRQVVALKRRQADEVMRELAEVLARPDDRARPCDYAARTETNGQPCAKCGAPAWDVCYDVFLCDKHVAIVDAGYNEYQRREEAKQHDCDKEYRVDCARWNNSEACKRGSMQLSPAEVEGEEYGREGIGFYTVGSGAFPRIRVGMWTADGEAINVEFSEAERLELICLLQKCTVEGE